LRSPVESQWEKCARYYQPEDNIFFGGRTTEGSSNGKSDVFTMRPVVAVIRFATVMDSLITPAGTMWHKHEPVGEASVELQAALEQVDKVLWRERYRPKSNFGGQNAMRWLQMGIYGNGVLFIDAAEDGDGLRYRSIHINECLIDVNHQGSINALYRVFKMTRRQIQDKFDVLLKGDIDGKVEIVHAVEENPNHEPNNPRDLKDKWPFTSVYYLPGDKQVLSEGFYSSFPYSVGSYLKYSGNVYGTGPGWLAISETVTANASRRDLIDGSEREVRPPVLAADDLDVDLTPGAVNYGAYDPVTGRQLVGPYKTGANFNPAQMIYEESMQQIESVMLTDLFRVLGESPNMTATEALIRQQEKAQLITPVLLRAQGEALGVQIERELDILQRQGKLPDMPEEVGDVEITYVAPLNALVDSEVLVQVQRGIEILGIQSQIDPSAMDVINTQKLAMMTAEIAFPAEVLATKREMERKQQEREGQQQAAQMMAAGESLSQTVKNFSDANI